MKHLVIGVICFILYGFTATWNVLNKETMLNIAKSGYRLNELELKILEGKETKADKIKLMPKYILGAYIQPYMLFLYLILIVAFLIKYFR